MCVLSDKHRRLVKQVFVLIGTVSSEVFRLQARVCVCLFVVMCQLFLMVGSASKQHISMMTVLGCCWVVVIVTRFDCGFDTTTKKLRFIWSDIGILMGFGLGVRVCAFPEVIKVIKLVIVWLKYVIRSLGYLEIGNNITKLHNNVVIVLRSSVLIVNRFFLRWNVNTLCRVAHWSIISTSTNIEPLGVDRSP